VKRWAGRLEVQTQIVDIPSTWETIFGEGIKKVWRTDIRGITLAMGEGSDRDSGREEKGAKQEMGGH